MAKMPGLNLKVFTPQQLADEWSRKTGSNVTVEQVLGYGKQGILQFSVTTLEDEGIPFSTLWEGDVGQEGMIVYIPITEKIFEKIIESNKPVEISSFFLELEGKSVECEIRSAECFQYGVGDLRILKQDVLVFEKQQFENEKVKLPEYSDPEHEYFALELSIAIEAHKAIFLDKEGSSKDSLTDRTRKWLEENYPEESMFNAFCERITTVILPK